MLIICGNDNILDIVGYIIKINFTRFSLPFEMWPLENVK